MDILLVSGTFIAIALLVNSKPKKPKKFDWQESISKKQLETSTLNHSSKLEYNLKDLNIELLKKIEWRRFEELCAAYFKEIGFLPKTQNFGADGGIDIHLFWKGLNHKVGIVQCKAWPDGLVGVAQVRELYGVMMSEKVRKAFFMTSNDFSKDAKKFAVDKNLTLITGVELIGKINKLSEEQKRKLFNLATVGDYTIPSCAGCGAKMIFRNGNPNFWGCTNYPNCRNTMKINNRRLI